MGNDTLRDLLNRIEELGRENLHLKVQMQDKWLALEQNAPYHSLFDKSRIPRLILNGSDGSILDANEAAVCFYGHEREALLRIPVVELDLSLHSGVWMQPLPERRNARHRIASGEIKEVEVLCSTIFLPDRPLLQWDILETAPVNPAPQALQRSENAFRQLVETAADLIYRTDSKGYFTYANPSCLRLTNCTLEEMRSLHFSDLVRPDYHYTVHTFYLSQAMRRVPTTYCEMPLLTRDGSELWIGQNVQLMRRGRRLIGFQAVARDITERKRLEQPLADHISHLHRRNRKLLSTLNRLQNHNTTLEDLALTDYMTGLLNHRAFQDELEKIYQSAVENSTDLSLLLIDLDGFKMVNDTKGHPAGDALLQAVGSLLLNRVRSSDVLARYGGEEFAIILPGADQNGAMAQAERFRRLVETTFEAEQITASFGVATLNEEITNRRHLIHSADAALYAAKQSGKNCVRHYDLLAPDVRTSIFAVVAQQPAAEGISSQPELEENPV